MNRAGFLVLVTAAPALTFGTRPRLAAATGVASVAIRRGPRQRLIGIPGGGCAGSRRTRGIVALARFLR